MRLILKCFLLFVVTCFCTAQETEPMGDTDSTNNQDGSLNTNTVGSTVSSNNNSKDESVSNTYNGAGSSSSMPVGSAIAPSYMSNGMETCLQGSGRSIQTGLIGYTDGSYEADVDCNRRRDAKLLSDLGMKVAAISRLCQDSVETFRAMMMSATPCPVIVSGKLVVGKRAFLLMKTQPNLYIPDYGKVAVRRTATWSKKTPTPKYSDTQKWYNSILGIGSDDDENEESSSDELVSVMFRRSIK
tara:strand:- start:2243 stop:2971 length:729 start_codon:yes stop_codon:yes gene_type:complete